jgi:hypothetical protein
MAVHGTEPELLVEQEVGAQVEADRCALHGLHQEGRLELVVEPHIEHIPTGEEIVWRAGRVMRTKASESVVKKSVRRIFGVLMPRK